MVVKTHTTLAEFLALPQTRPYLELMDGEVIEKPSPNRNHSRLVTWLIFVLMSYVERTGEAVVDSELRHNFAEEEWVFLPDISVTLRERLTYSPADTPPGAYEVLPDLAIEVVSPDDQPGRLQRRIAHYMRSGVRLLWVVDPDAEKVTVWKPGELPHDFSGTSTIRAEGVLSDFSLDLGEMFGRLHQP
ncbi:MAG: Uma2 family endonuclease [Dehalococcoidia bacterium]